MSIGALETGEIARDVRPFLIAGVFEENGWIRRDRRLLELRTRIRSVVVKTYALKREEAVRCNLKGSLEQLARLGVCLEASIFCALCIS